MKKVLILLGVVAALGLLLYLVPKQEDRVSSGSATPDVILPGINAETVKKIYIDRPNKARVILFKEGDEWRTDIPGMGVFPAETQNIDELFKLMADSRIVKQISNNPANHGTFDVDDAKGIGISFLADADRMLGEIIVGKLAFNFRSNYVRLKGANEVYELGGDLRRLLDRDADAWRDRTLVRIEPAQIAELTFQNPADPKPFTIKRSPDGPWGFYAPDNPDLDDTEVDMQAINKILNQFSVIIARTVSDTSSATDLKSFGLDPPKATVKITDAAGKVTTLKFGMEAKDQSYPAMREGSSAIYHVPTWIYETMTPAAKSLTSQTGTSGPGNEVKVQPQKEQRNVQERTRKSVEEGSKDR